MYTQLDRILEKAMDGQHSFFFNTVIIYDTVQQRYQGGEEGSQDRGRGEDQYHDRHTRYCGP